MHGVVVTTNIKAKPSFTLLTKKKEHKIFLVSEITYL